MQKNYACDKLFGRSIDKKKIMIANKMEYKSTSTRETLK